ncbi:MAG: hypothetical protein K1X57_18295 [Gemmataceae bacterium]|nr:hypothetical protein [Gemmataceae bacterium]
MAFILIVAFAPVALACPNCKEAVAASGDQTGEDDPLREARAYNSSILFMLAVPYSMLGAGGIVGYRLYRSAQKHRTTPPGGL